jgi:hypothetical protein
LDLLSPTTLSSPEALSSLHSLFSGRNPSLYRISLSLCAVVVVRTGVEISRGGYVDVVGC